MAGSAPATADETKAARIAEYEAARDALDEAVMGLRAGTIVGGWSVVELVAHVTAWEERAASLVPQLVRGEPAPDVDVETFNAEAARRGRRDDPYQQLGRYGYARRSLVAALRDAPAEAFAGGLLVEQLEKEIGHAREHAAELRAATEQIDREEGERFSAAPIELIWHGWEGYQRQLAAAIAELTDEQLSLRAAPGLRTVGEQVRHIVAVRAGWLHGDLAEGGPEWDRIAGWFDDDVAVSADDLRAGLDDTWRFIRECLDRWTPEQFLEVVHSHVPGDEGQRFRRGWVMYHLLEHDMHHGGELAFLLGMHGLPAPRI